MSRGQRPREWMVLERTTIVTDQERQKAEELISRLETTVGQIFPRDIANANGTSATTNSATECDSADAMRPTAPNINPIMKVGLSPRRWTIGRMNPPWMIAPSTPNPAKRYPVVDTPNPNRCATNSANVVWKTANANQYRKSIVRTRLTTGLRS